MDQHGLRLRSREFTVEALVTITRKVPVPVPVSARSEEVAETRWTRRCWRGLWVVGSVGSAASTWTFGSIW